MYPITRESVMAAISSSVAEKAVCWCDGRKKRRRRILRRVTHLAVGGRVIGGAGIGEGISFPLCNSVSPVVQAFDSQPPRPQSYTGRHRGNQNLCTALTRSPFDQHDPPRSGSLGRRSLPSFARLARFDFVQARLPTP